MIRSQVAFWPLTSWRKLLCEWDRRMEKESLGQNITARPQSSASAAAPVLALRLPKGCSQQMKLSK